MYRTDVYFLSKTLAEAPLFVALPVLFTTICYFMVGFNTDLARYFTALLIVTLVANVATSFGEQIPRWLLNYMRSPGSHGEFVTNFSRGVSDYRLLVSGYLISCASTSVSMALSIGPPVVIPFLLFGGFFLNTG